MTTFSFEYEKVDGIPNFDAIPADDLAAFFRTASTMRGSRVKILKAHFGCENQTATARQLSVLMGYKNHNAINLQYGSFAKSLALEFGIHGDKYKKQYFDWLYFLVEFFPPSRTESRKEWQLQLRKIVVQALRQLGW